MPPSSGAVSVAWSSMPPIVTTLKRPPDWGTIYRMVSRGKKWRHLIDEAYAGQKDYEEASNYHHSYTRKHHWWHFW